MTRGGVPYFTLTSLSLLAYALRRVWLSRFAAAMMLVVCWPVFSRLESHAAISQAALPRGLEVVFSTAGYGYLATMFLTGVALLLMTTSRLGPRWLGEATAVATGSIGLASILAYCFGPYVSATPATISASSAQVALGAWVTSAAILFSRPDRSLMRVVDSNDVAGRWARQLMLASLLAPVAAALIAIHGLLTGWLAQGEALAVTVVVEALIMSFLVWAAARWVSDVDRCRAKAEDELHKQSIQLGALTEKLSLKNRDLEERVNQRTAELKEAQFEILQRLAMAAEYRDDSTGEHIHRVGNLSAMIAERLSLSEEQCELIREAAPLHDLGKIAVPDSILQKQGPLTPDEARIMREHARIGAEILSGGRSPVLRVAEQIAISHHERWDGSGYPYGLWRDEIPLVGRIVAVADVFDALTNARPYKPAWSFAHASEEIRFQAGAHFDPKVVEAFLTCLPFLREDSLDEAA